MEEFHLYVWPEVNVYRYIIYELTTGGKYCRRHQLTLCDEILTNRVAAGIIQNKMSTNSRAERTITVSRLSGHSSKKSHEAL